MEQDFLVHFEVQEEKVLKYFPKCPLNTNMNSTHLPIKFLLLRCHVDTLKRGQYISGYSVGGVSIQNIWLTVWLLQQSQFVQQPTYREHEGIMPLPFHWSKHVLLNHSE